MIELRDKFIWDALVLTKQRFNGWKDEKSLSIIFV